MDETLPVELLAQCFLRLTSFQDIAMVKQVCRRWRHGMREALAFRKTLSFAGWRVDDASVSKLVNEAVSLLDLDISAGSWGCRITNLALYGIANSNCCRNLKSISLWGVTAITDEGVVRLVCSANSLEKLNVGATFITDLSLFAISTHCQILKVVNMWGCKRITERGLLELAKGCTRLEAMNIWGMRINSISLQALLALNPRLQLRGAA